MGLGIYIYSCCLLSTPCDVFTIQALVVQIRQRIGKDLVGGGLGTKRVAHQHEAMAHDYHLIKLENLAEEHISRLELILVAVAVDCDEDVHVVRRGQNLGKFSFLDRKNSTWA